MLREEFARVTPESVGISSASISRLIDKLESIAEPHGLMIMRHGKICAEGWWSPYAPGIRHGLQSHTKTYAATAVGIAYTEGLLRLTDRIIDIFPDEAPANPSENLKKLTIHHVLCMGCGMDEMPRPTADWIRDFLAVPVNHEPGTAYMYNSMGSTLLGAIVKRITGLGLHDYLKPRLFDKIGIDADNLRWLCMPDGMEIGGGGMFATTEDNLRLMKLYADGGVWGGERILAEDYVSLATTVQNQSATEERNNPLATDNFLGYGYQIWMCKPSGSYRADGAMGQFTIVLPDRDMIIAITENAQGGTGSQGAQAVLDAMWEFVDEIKDGAELPGDCDASDRLARRMEMLSLARPVFSPYSPCARAIDGVKYRLVGGYFSLLSKSAFMTGEKLPEGISEFGFDFSTGLCKLSYLQDGESCTVDIATDGARKENIVGSAVPNIALASGAWVEDSTFEACLRWVETATYRSFKFAFSGDEVSITSAPAMMFGMAEPEPIRAVKI